tara:strand:+ start:302 stop:2068 length:1767 start_codon:yes stop_codon:yes gene_type:complete
MATANTYLKVTEVDFDDIRTNLKSYLSTQDQFQDYNFEGSALSTLLDVLAYNTHYNAFYLNMLANEMFLDTAQQRDSVVSRAKELGYLPSSAIGSQANVSLTFTGIANTTSQFTIPRNATFTTTVDDVSYTYVVPTAKTVLNISNTYSTSVIIKEGTPLTHRFTVSTTNPVRYILPNANIDTSSIKVTVQESSVDTTTTEYLQATNTNQVSSNSPIYFLEESADKKYEIVFSPGILGKPVKNGNIVIVEYLVCNASDTDGASVFSVDNLNLGVSYTSVAIVTNKASSGGSDSESISSIKFNAPRNFQTQNRAIIKNDYERIISSENSDIQSVTAFGGELADPAVYGKVFIALKPVGALQSTENKKASIKTSIIDRTPLGVDPVMIDPEYTYIIPTIKVFYNRTTSSATTSEVETSALSAIADFSTNNLEQFDKRFRFSRFVRSLDNLTVAEILNTDASIQMQKKIIPLLNVSQSIVILFNNKIKTSTLSSTQFVYETFNCFFDDDGLGTVRVYRFDDTNTKVIQESNIGTIDYDTGKISLSDFKPTSLVGSQIEINVTPDSLDVTPVREQILIMQSVDADVTAISEFE